MGCHWHQAFNLRNLLIMFGQGIYGGAAGAAGISIDGSRAVNFIANGQTPGTSGMSLEDYITAVVHATKPPLVNMSSGANIERGNSGLLSQTLSITVTKQSTTTDIASVVVTSNQGYNSGDIKTGTGNQTINHNVTLTLNTDETFTVTATTVDSKTATDTAAFAWKYGRHWGKINKKTGILDADILALAGAGIGTGKDLTEQIDKSFDGIDTSSDYFIYVFKDSFGSAQFKIGGFLNNDFTLARNDSFTNAYGETFTIKCYVSNNPLGSLPDFDAETA